VILDDSRPGLEIRVSNASGTLIQKVGLVGSTAAITLEEFPVILSVSDAAGKPVSASFPDGGVTVSVREQAGDPRPKLLVWKESAAEAAWISTPSDLSNLDGGESIAQLGTPVLLEMPTLLASLALGDLARRRGWAVNLPDYMVAYANELYSLSVRPIGSRVPPNSATAGNGFGGKMTDHAPPDGTPSSRGDFLDNSKGVIDILDLRLAPTWRERISRRSQTTLIIIAPVNTHLKEPSLQRVIARMAMVLRDGDLKEFTDLSQWKEIFEKDLAKDALSLVGEVGTDDLVARGLSEAIRDRDTITSETSCTNLSLLLARQGFPARLTAMRVLEVREALENMLNIIRGLPSDEIPKGIRNFRSLVHECPPEFWDPSSDPLNTILEGQSLQLLERCLSRNWPAALALSQDMTRLDPDNASLRWDWICTAMNATDGGRNPDLRRSAARLAIENLRRNPDANAHSRYLRKRSERIRAQILAGDYCECGEFRFITRSSCSHCGLPNPRYIGRPAS
jgi:hypothetical protein